MNRAGTSSFALHGAKSPLSPVILSVPHAGREYPEALIAALGTSLSFLLPLEDRLVDRIAIGARRHETLIAANRARAWIDLNRALWERDPLIEDGVSDQSLPRSSEKLRSGLGLVPRRCGSVRNIWRRTWSSGEIESRIRDDYRPYHAMLGTLLKSACSKYGTALLLDIHSMPPVSRPEPPRIVIGDRFGRSASGRLTSLCEAVADRHGYRCAVNSPYAGGHVLDRHGRPAAGIHAIQIEIDRSTYLDDDLKQLGAGASAITAMLRAMIDALEDAITPGAIAAE